MERILHIGMSDVLGGIEVFIMNMYRKIDKTRIQFDFLTFTPTIPFEDEIIKLGGKIFYITPRKESLFNNRKELNNFFVEHPEYRIAHCHLNSCSYVDPGKIAKKHGLKVIFHSHNSGLKGNLTTKTLHRYNKLILNSYADLKFSCSREAGSFMFYGDEKDIRVIPNAIDGEKFKYNPLVRREVRRELNIDNELVIGTIGRLTTQKNHKFMLEIHSNIMKYNPYAKLIIGGSGPLLEELVAYADELNITKNVVFLGAVTNPERYIQAMDIFLMPSFYEGLSISALEAHASGLIVVASEFVPSSTYIQGLVKKLSLNESALKWAEYIVNIDLPDRNSYWHEFEHSEYEISNNVDGILKIYNDLSY